MPQLSFEERIRSIINKKPNWPLIVEFAGLPRLGKTEATDSLLDLLRKSDCKSVAYVQDQFDCPIIDKWEIDYSAWGIANLIKQFYDFKHQGYQIIITDRGFFDAVVWLKLKSEREKNKQEICLLLRNLAMTNLWWSHLASVVVFDTQNIQLALERARERRLYRGKSLVTNEDVLPSLQAAYYEEGMNINNVQLQNKHHIIVKTLYAEGNNISKVLNEAAEIVISTLENIT